MGKGHFISSRVLNQSDRNPEINSKVAKEKQQEEEENLERLAHIIGKCGWIPGLSSCHPGSVSGPLLHTGAYRWG